MAEGESSTGLFDSIRNLVATSVAIIQTRLEILSTEVEEEKIRIAQLLMFAALSFFFLSLGVVFLALLLVVLFWDTNRVAVLGSLAGIFLAAGVISWLAYRTKTKSKIFATSISELAQDRNQLKS